MIPIGNFAAAVQSGDVREIQKAYPRIPANQQRGWETTFRQWKPESAEIRGVKGVASNEAGITIVDFVMAVKFSDRATKTAVSVPPYRYRARLKREGPNVVLLELTHLGAPR